MTTETPDSAGPGDAPAFRFGESATRAEHLAACKVRALELLDADPHGNGGQQAFTSMASDLRKHPETAHHGETVILGMSMLMAGHLSDPTEMRRWIEGFN